MKKEVSPAVMAAVLGVVVLVIAIIGYRVFAGSRYTPEKKGSEQAMQKFEQTGEFYKPPAGAPVPGGASGGGQSGGPPTSYNLQPPPH